MASKTVHVFPADGAWQVKSEGKSGTVFDTQRKAVEAARKSIKTYGAGQFVVHGKKGKIQHYETYRMAPVQDPPKKSPLAAKIERAVSELALERVRSDSPREHPSTK